MLLALIRAGARTAFVATRESSHLRETLALAAEIEGAPAPIVVLGDLAQSEDCEHMAHDILTRLGGADGIVNNAGVPNVGSGAPFWEVSSADWRRMSHTNTDGIFFLTKALVPHMIARGSGRIVNISTSERTLVRKHLAPYGPTKAFVEAASLIFAQDLRGSGVTVNVLVPGGAVDTQSDISGIATPGKAFLPADIMNEPLLWLLSDDAHSHTGERFVANLWDKELPIVKRILAARQQIFNV
jgi:3-oxoacyl-[acyl-carrier protein] reductase